MKYDWYCFWMVLKIKTDEIIFGDNIFENARNIKKIQYMFEKMSEVFLKEFDVKELSKMWVDFDKNKAGDDYKNVFEHFVNYLHYASDRMNINRWLYCKLSINLAFDLVYGLVDAKEWYEKCSKYDENYQTILEKEVEKWFECEFETIYTELIKIDSNYNKCNENLDGEV